MLNQQNRQAFAAWIQALGRGDIDTYAKIFEMVRVFVTTLSPPHTATGDGVQEIFEPLGAQLRRSEIRYYEILFAMATGYHTADRTMNLLTAIDGDEYALHQIREHYSIPAFRPADNGPTVLMQLLWLQLRRPDVADLYHL